MVNFLLYIRVFVLLFVRIHKESGSSVSVIFLSERHIPYKSSHGAT